MKSLDSKSTTATDPKQNIGLPKDSEGNSSSESLIEIKLNECIKKSDISDFDLRALVVKCSSCGHQINHFSGKECKRHRKLGVLTCKDCYDFYGSSEFSQDESGYNYCTWCGNGGKLMVCDYCPNGFCDPCIRRNFGRAEISAAMKEGWKCYCCNNRRLKPKMKFCNLILEKRVQKEKRKAPQKPVLEDSWLQAAFNESEVVCKKFHRKMAKLKSIGVSKSKSLKHIVKKMEEIINSHKADLKTITLSLGKQYEAYMQQLDQNNSNSDCVVIDEDNKDDVSLSITEDLKDKKIQAKLLLLKSSSESEDLDRTDIKYNGQLDSKNLKDEKHSSELECEANDSETSQTLKSNEYETPEIKVINEIKANDSEESETKNGIDEPESKAKRALKFVDFSDTGSSSADEKLNVKELLEKVCENSEKEANEINHKDPKLDLHPRVEILRCDHLLKEGETSLKISNELDEDQLDKLVNSLCKFPISRKRTQSWKKQKCGPLCSKKAAAKKELMESSSSISLSSEEEEQQKKVESKTSENIKLSSVPDRSPDDSGGSSSELFESEEEEEKKPSKKSRASKKAENSDSSDDFVLPSKKRKHDKLLHGSLISDDEKKSKEKKDKRGPKRKRQLLLSSDEEKRERKKSDNSSTSTTSSDDEDAKKKKPKKLRRIKKVGSSSDDEEEQDEEDASPGKGRKNIRKIVSQKKLAQSTKEAQLEEKERRKRISDRQKLYNKIEDMSSDGKQVITRKMVLEVDHDSKSEVVEIHPDLVCKLKPHQVNGVKFMWECTIETVKDLDKPGSGCILAHCMGLGKTLQVITFLHTCLTNPIISKNITRAMVICPYNTALNWVTEFEFWLQDIEGDVVVHQLTNVKTNFERMDILKYWFVDGGVLIVSYDIFRRLSANKIGRLRAKEVKQIHTHLLDPGPDIVVCDEGHILKNDKSAISVATNKLVTKRRIVLTGTPLQNNLREYHCMLSFVKPNLLGTTKEFRNRFVNPIINGQYDDSNDYDVKLMKKRIHILHKLLEGCVQRCDYLALTKFLPAKHEFVISVKLSETQIKMYQRYLERRSEAQKDTKAMGKTLFVDFNNLRCIWTHPFICHVSHERLEYKRLFKDESDEEFINDATESSEKSASETTDCESSKENEEDPKRNYRTRSKVAEGGDDVEEIEEVSEDVKQWYHEFISDDDKYNLELSGKMVLLMEILRECETIGDKIILFSQSLLALDCIENMLEYCASQPVSEEDKKRDALGTWTKGIDYFRMDGGTSVDFRKNYIDMFNDSANERARFFLISTRAGSLGTNLVGANRVILLDTSWNPSHDVQAIFRVYRFGQVKPVYIYRLLAQGTMEEKIYDRQVTKLSLSCRVVDEQQIDRHFSAADLAELYSFEPSPVPETTPMMPNDRLLAEMLIKKKEWIIKYHEHDSLLQNQTEEELTEEERQAAWTEYENEREGRGPATTANYGLNIEDLSNITKEPDFSQDYEGKMIPDIKVIIECVFESLKCQIPVSPTTMQFKERLLSAVDAVRQKLQQNQLKVLRMKQECCARGPVPNSMNKYLGELNQSLKSLKDYIQKLIQVIQSERIQQAQYQAQPRPQPQAAYYQRWQTRQPNMQQPFPQVRTIYVPPGFMYNNQGVRYQFATSTPRPNLYTTNSTYTNSKPTEEPIVTYEEDNSSAAPEVATNSKKTTVIIEDIS